MKLIENIKYALGSILLNKKRSILTMIGIVIGLSSVITIVSVGDTISFVLREFFSSTFGGNCIQAYSFCNDGDFMQYLLTDEEIDIFLDGAPDSVVDVIRKSDFAYTGKAFVDDDMYSNASVSGVSSGFAKASNIKIAEGRFISKRDCDEVKPAVVISDIAAKNCFGSAKESIGKQISLQGYTAEGEIAYSEAVVIGVYEYKDQKGKLKSISDKRMFSTEIYCPFTYQDYLGNIGERKDTHFIEILCNESTDIDEVEAYAMNFLSSRYTDKENYFYSVRDIREDLAQVTMMVNVVTIVFVVVAAISLLVGGIGLMNTMLVTVTERTKEIGIKKALGAKKNTIRTQFLTESIVICVIACIIGVFIGALIGTIIESNIDKIIGLINNKTLVYFLKNTTIKVTPSFSAVLVSVIFSVTVGVVFGYYPANKGAKMQPVDALRYE